MSSAHVLPSKLLNQYKVGLPTLVNRTNSVNNNFNPQMLSKNTAPLYESTYVKFYRPSCIRMKLAFFTSTENEKMYSRL